MKIYNNCSDNATIVSNHFIDCYMAEANGEFVKIYLFLLRISQNPTSDFSISSIADHFNHTEKDILRALKYWEHMHLLRLEFNGDKSISGIHLLNIMQSSEDYAKSAALVTDDRQSEIVNPEPVAANKPATPSKAEAPAVASITPIRPAEQPRKEYSADEIKEFIKDPDVCELFFIIEAYIKHPLSSNDQNIILFWYDSLQLCPELIEYLVEYSVSMKHFSIRYMNKIALSWHEEHVTTVEQAKEIAAIRNQFYYAVMKSFGITGRNLVDSEIAFINKWSQDYAFELPIIQEALNRTITNLHEPDFKYADSILTSWFQNQVHTMEDVKRLDLIHEKNKRKKPEQSNAKATRFSNFNQRQYDYNQLERQLLNTSATN